MKDIRTEVEKQLAVNKLDVNDTRIKYMVSANEYYSEDVYDGDDLDKAIEIFAGEEKAMLTAWCMIDAILGNMVAKIYK